MSDGKLTPEQLVGLHSLLPKFHSTSLVEVPSGSKSSRRCKRKFHKQKAKQGGRWWKGYYAEV